MQFYLAYYTMGILWDVTMKHRTLKNVNNCLNTNIYSYLETSGGQILIYIYMLFIFQHQCKLDIAGSLRQLFSSIGVY